jgi:hypothetical protein
MNPLAERTGQQPLFSFAAKKFQGLRRFSARNEKTPLLAGEGGGCWQAPF